MVVVERGRGYVQRKCSGVLESNVKKKYVSLVLIVCGLKHAAF